MAGQVATQARSDRRAFGIGGALDGLGLRRDAGGKQKEDEEREQSLAHG